MRWKKRKVKELNHLDMLIHKKRGVFFSPSFK